MVRCPAGVRMQPPRPKEVVALTRRMALAVLMSGCVSIPRGRPKDVSPERLRRAIESLVSIAGERRFARLRGALDWLQAAERQTDIGLVSDEYCASLERASKVLLEYKWSAGAQASVLEDVALELEAKGRHCLALRIGMGGAVTLTVRTMRAVEFVSGWQVQYLLKFDDWLRWDPRTFPQLSSPTVARVEPGRYWFWAKDPRSRTNGERQLVEVVGQSDMVVDLPVPQ
jgi:hypothetical protein